MITLIINFIGSQGTLLLHVSKSANRTARKAALYFASKDISQVLFAALQVAVIVSMSRVVSPI